MNTQTESTMRGTVLKKTTGCYHVTSNSCTIVCSISSKLRKSLVYPTADPSSVRHRVVAVEDITMVDPIAIGDEVVFSRSDDGTGVITEVLPRKRKLSRLAAGKNPLEQVIVSNADQVIPVRASMSVRRR